jgi:O-antigen/teichoic acid export membrane protein
MGATSRVAVAVSGAATTILIARLLGADGAGNFAVAQTIVYVLTVLATLGVEHGVAYYVSSGAWNVRPAFATSMRVACVSGCTGALLGVLARLAVPSAFGSLSVAECAVAAAALPFALAWFYGSYVALADNHYEGFVLPPAAQSIAQLALVAALAIPFGVSGAVVALLASHAITGTVTFAWGRRRLRGHDGQPPPGQLRRALNFGVKGYAGNALQVLNYRVDFFVLSAVATTAVLGHYAVAVGVTTLLWLLPQAVSDVLFPRVAALSASPERSAEEQRAFVEAKSLRHTVLLVVAGAIGLAVAMALLIVPIYGPDFQQSVELGLIRLPGVALLGIGGTLSAATIGRGFPQYGLYIALVSTPATLVLYGLLIPAYDAPGAALASSLSFTLNFILALWFYRRATGLNALRMMWPTASELRDYRELAPKVREWAAGLRRSRA